MHLAALTKPADVGKLMRAIKETKGLQPASVVALKLLPHVLLRPGELRAGRCEEMNWDTAQWTVPAALMKGKGNKRREHLVPLSRQALAILKSSHKITGDDGYMFPAIGGKGRPLSENTLNAALETLGYTSDIHTPHGFRSTASSCTSTGTTAAKSSRSWRTWTGTKSAKFTTAPSASRNGRK